MPSFLLQLESEIADRLLSVPFFAGAGIEVLVSPQKNIVAEIQQRIAKVKTLIAPKVISASKPNRGLKGTYFEEIRIEVAVFQNPLIKGDLPDALEIAEAIHDPGLKGWTPASLSGELISADHGIEQIPDERLNIWVANFIARGGPDAVILPQVATPGYSSVDASITLTCATAGAAIFWTTDGTLPAPRNGLLYTAPLALEPGVTLRARAFLAGYRDSQKLEQIIS